MKSPNGRTGFLVACATLVVAIALHARAIPARAESATLRLGEGSALWIEGKSNMHDFESRTAELSVKVKWEGGGAPATAADIEAIVREGRLREIEVEVPVTTLRSRKRGLDKNLWQDLRAEANPKIRFEVESDGLRADAAGGDTLMVHAEGRLQVAGKEQKVAFDARAWRADKGLWVEGRKPLRMTEFGIKPRTMMLGTLRVRDEVVVRWRLLLMPGNP